MALDDREVTFGETTFSIGKMLPVESKKVFMEHVRPMLEGALGAQVSEGGGGIEMALGIVARAPQAHYDALMRQLYQRITFTSAAGATPRPLANNEEMAFDGLDMAHILMLDVRAFMVNFRESWDVIASQFPSLSQLTAQLNPQTLTPSSTTQ